MSAFDWGDFHEPEYTRRCKRCGQGGLEWKELANGRYILVDRAGKHVCKPDSISAAEKETTDEMPYM